MRKPKTVRLRPPDPDNELSTSIVIRVSNKMREKLRTAAYKARLPASVHARRLIEHGLKQKRAVP